MVKQIGMYVRALFIPPVVQNRSKLLSRRRLSANVSDGRLFDLTRYALMAIVIRHG